MYNTPGGISAGVEGVATVSRDFSQSRMYFLKVARQVWPRDNPAKPNLSKIEDVEQPDRYFALLSAHFLGRMHLRGEGVRQDVKVAKMWFERAAKEGDKESLNALGIISRDGLLDGKSKEDDAIVQFGRAAAQDLAEAILNLGKLYYRKGNMVLAKTYFENAIRHGSQFEAYYYAATIHAHAARSSPGQNGGSCAAAVSYYKTVAERGCWKNNVVAEAEKYWNSPDPSLREGAIVRWQIAADRGVEVAQNNLAYVLEEVAKNHLKGISADSTLTDDYNRTARDALMYWTRSAAQGDLDAMVKLGDLHYHGIGVDEPPILRQEKAAGYYHAAIDSFSTIAMWNVGWMYENGIGAQRDFHLAKRYYDMALETNHHAYFPIVLSLIKLHLRSLWYIMRGGKQQNLILWGDDENEGWWPKLWKSEQSGSGTDGSNRPKVVDIDDEDPIKRARDIRDAAVGIGGDDEDPGEDYFDGMTRRRGGGGVNGDGVGDGEFEEWEDDWELVILAALAVTIGALVMLRRYYEQRRLEALERRRREQRAAEQQEEQQQQHQHQREPQHLHHQQAMGDRVPNPDMNPPPPPPMPGAGLDDPLLQNMAIFML
ncbi:ERAD-associated protein [Serendipita sp. 411]|nr:ERAD-associated protein [Serendipita sp. 411]